jgi:hypothetical protein
VSNQTNDDEPVQLDQVNEELTDSLDRCRSIVEDCRSKLAKGFIASRAAGNSASGPSPN